MKAAFVKISLLLKMEIKNSNWPGKDIKPPGMKTVIHIMTPHYFIRVCIFGLFDSSSSVSLT